MDGITHITVDGNLPMQLKLKALKKLFSALNKIKGFIGVGFTLFNVLNN